MKNHHQFFCFLTLFCLTFISFDVTAQRNQLQQSIEIEWKNGVASIVNGEEVRILQEPNEPAKLFFRTPLNNFTAFSFKLNDVVWSGSEHFIDKSDIVDYVSVASKRRYVNIIVPLPTINVNEVNTLQLTLEVDQNGIFRNGNTRRIVSNSVLRTGDWYKFGIESTGMYKLTYEFLMSLGIDVASIPHSNFSVFGQQGGMLPKAAGVSRVDDLQEIPIVAVSSSATLQPGDYIIFYGEGPDMWSFENDRFVHEKHLYSSHKTYFITTDQGDGKRVQNVNPPVGTPDITLNTFHDHAFIEEDITNLNKSGSDWLGNDFGINQQQTFEFNFPNLVTAATAFLDYRIAARSTSGSSSFTINANDATISTFNIPTIGGVSYPPAAKESENTVTFAANNENIDIEVVFDQPNFAANAWLDYLSLNVTRNLRLTGSSMLFRNSESSAHNLVRYQMSGVSGSTSIWDVTDQFNITAINYDLAGDVASFNAQGGQINQYATYNDAVLEPIAFGKISNQDLHGLSDADMIIVTRAALLQPATALANFHFEQEGLISHVVTLDQVFNEFSSGNQDVTAIRDFLKMFYDRNNNYPDYACLFGDGSFENRSLGDYYIPTFQSTETLITRDSYVSDDYFGFLDDGEGESIDNAIYDLDIGIGRIPADNVSKGNVAVEKVRKYYDEQSYGRWRNIGTIVADDEDNNTHINDGQSLIDPFRAGNPVMNIEKIYLDAFRQIAGSGGGLYPDVNDAINSRMFKGTLFFSYIGHGGTNGLAEERVVRLEDIDSWDNEYKMPLFITATCEFTRYDDIERYSAGERAFFKEGGGPIALVTTVRLVYSSANFTMNKSFMNAFEDGIYDTSIKLGDILVEAKNNTPTGEGNRKFTLIGDPALRIAFPEFNVSTTHIEGVDFIPGNDTLKALSKVTIEGEVQYDNGDLMDDFNGLVYPTIYDKVKTLTTLGNDEGSNIRDFDVQNSIVYSGKVQAENGKFAFTFVVPKDIVYAIGDGRISYYANDEMRDASGINTVLVGGGGTLDSNSIDNDDPIVEVFMDDESWISGDFTDTDPDLLVKLFDDNGINTVGSGVGHDIVAILDEDRENSINLNDFYESELNSYQRGKILFPLEDIEPGTHSITVKAWDVFNNSGEGFTEFVVAESAELALDHVLNYPNPFTTNTQFMFEHNRKGDVLDVRIEVFTVSGKLVKTLQETELSDNRRVEIPWDGLDDFGDKIGKGVYIYRVQVKDSGGNKIEAFQKLVLLR